MIKFIAPAFLPGVSLMKNSHMIMISVCFFLSILAVSYGLGEKLARMAEISKRIFNSTIFDNSETGYHWAVNKIKNWNNVDGDETLNKANVEVGDNFVTVTNPITQVSTTYDLSQQHGEFEKTDLALHLCNDGGEAYAASYLTTAEHIRKVQSDKYNLTWVNCEMASFINFGASANALHNEFAEGAIFQSLDVLDYSVIHLSAFERTIRSYTQKLRRISGARDVTDTLSDMKRAGDWLENKNNPRISGVEHEYLTEAKKTVVFMPFLGGVMGSGHSVVGNRFVYLKACFWSFYQHFPYIVAGVTRQTDVDWLIKESGMPWYDVILLDNLPKPAGLPVGLVQTVRRRLLPDGPWNRVFDYVMFTESDQILLWRNAQHLFNDLLIHPNRMLVPHRLMAYRNDIVELVFNQKIDKAAFSGDTWLQHSCCMTRQNCVDRKEYVQLSSPGWNVVEYLGLFIPLGNMNFIGQTLRPCKLRSRLAKFEYCT